MADTDVVQPDTGTGSASGPAPASTVAVSPDSSPSATANIPDAGQVQSGPTATQPAQAPPPPPPPKENIAGTVYHGILSALGGSNDVTLSRDPNTGKMVASVAKRGPGQQWKQIIAGALQGFGAATAAGANIGPGGATRAFGAGFMGEEQQQDKQKQGQVERANQEYDYQQQARVRQAQSSLLNLEISAKTLELARKGVESNYFDADRMNQFKQTVRDMGGQDLGIANGFSDVVAMHKGDPSLMKAQTEGRVIGTPEIGPDNKILGMHYALLPPEWGRQRITEDRQLPTTVPPKKPGDAPTIEWKTVPAGSMSQADFTVAYQGQVKNFMDLELAQKKQQDESANEAARTAVEASKAPSEIAKNFSEQRKNDMEAQTLAAQNSPDDMDTVADSLAHNRIAVSMVPKRYAKGSASWNQLMSRADQISMSESGQHFNAEQNEVSYRQQQEVIKDYTTGQPAQNIASFDTLLGHALDLSKSVNSLRNSSIPLANMPINKLKRMTGGSNAPAIQEFLTEMDAVQREWPSLLKNNRALHAEDIEAGEKALNENLSPAQLQAALKGITRTSIVRLRATNQNFKRVTGNNVPMLISPEGSAALQHFGFDPQSVYGRSNTTRDDAKLRPQNATGEVHNSKGDLIGWSVPDGKGGQKFQQLGAP